MIIQSEKVFFEDEFIKAQIEIKEGRITCIFPYASFKADYDFGNKRIIPGFYDIHCHGIKGYFTNDDDPEGLKMWAGELPKEGICGFIPTTVTAAYEEYLSIFSNIRKVMNTDYDGAEILGANLEGPYINPKYKGAHPLNLIRKPDIREFEDLYEKSGGLIKIMTMAPERDENHEFIRHFKDKLNLSIGHSDVSASEAYKALEEGMKCFTHTFNSMAPFKHRDGGTVNAALASDSYAEIICDGRMVSPDALKIFMKMKKEKAVMVSDCLPGKGLKPGSRFMFGGREIEICEDGGARECESGKTAGSTLRFNDGLRRLTEETGLEFKDAVKTCTLNPMLYLGIKDRGLIKEGYVADITVIDDDYNVLDTFVKGKLQ